MFTSRRLRLRQIRSRPISGSTICYAQAGQLELARIQGREILRVSPKFDMATYAQSLTYKDQEDSRRSLEALAKAFAPSVVVQTAAA